jgi:hypothetical protein
MKTSIMKNILYAFVLILFCMSCEKEDFDIDNPEVEKFVQQIKNGTYDNYSLGENGEKLWTIMPRFTTEHIPLLIKLSNDTMLVCPSDHFPTNPVSSIRPYRIIDDNLCIMVGEYLLWCVEGIINERGFGSLTPVLMKNGEYTEEGLSGAEILKVRKYYQNWWDEYGKAGDLNKLVLEGTPYTWH